jgi:hypothetical protein
MIKNRMKKHMRIKDKAYLNFFETINYEVKEMMKEKDLYEDYDDSFAVDKKKDSLTFEIKENLFHIVFNEKLLSFLWKKIQKINLDEEATARELERIRQQRDNPTPQILQEAQRKSINLKEKIVNEIKNAENKFSFLGEMQTLNVPPPSKYSIMKQEEEEERDESGLLPFELVELKRRLRNAFLMNKDKNKHKNPDVMMTVEERLKEEALKQKWDLSNFSRFKASRKHLGNEFTRGVCHLAKRFRRLKILKEIDKLKDQKKRMRKGKKGRNKRKRGFNKSALLDFQEKTILEKEDENDIKIQINMNQIHQSDEIFSIADLFGFDEIRSRQRMNHLSPKSDQSKSPMATPMAKRNSRASAEEKTSIMKKFKFSFTRKEAKCILLAFFKRLDEKAE